MQHRLRSIVPLLSGCAALVGLGCDSHVPLGTLSSTTPALLWSATFEPGDLSEWESDGQGGIYIDNNASSPAVTNERTHSGHFAGKVTMGPTTGSALNMQSSSYFFRDQPSQTQAYYGAWYYIPSTVTVRSWMSLSHFRSSSTSDGTNIIPYWDLNLWPVHDGSLPPGTLPVGSLATHFYNFVTATNAIPLTYLAVPTDRWVHFEVMIRKALDATGQVTVWQDDVMIVDLQNVITGASDWLQWDAGGSSTDLVPATSSIYVDDATISLERVGAAAIIGDRG